MKPLRTVFATAAVSYLAATALIYAWLVFGPFPESAWP